MCPKRSQTTCVHIVELLFWPICVFTIFSQSFSFRYSTACCENRETNKRKSQFFPVETIFPRSVWHFLSIESPRVVFLCFTPVLFSFSHFLRKEKFFNEKEKKKIFCAAVLVTLKNRRILQVGAAVCFSLHREAIKGECSMKNWNVNWKVKKLFFYFFQQEFSYFSFSLINKNE